MTLMIGMVAFLILGRVTCADHPGVKVRITDTGFDLAVKIAVDSLRQKAEAGTITVGKNGVLYDGLLTTVDNAKVKNLEFGSTSLRTVARKSLRLQMREAKATVSATAHMFIFPRTVQLSLTDVSINLDLSVGVNNGRPQIKVVACHVTNIKIGGASFLNMVIDAFRTPLSKEACQRLQNFIESPLNDAIRNFTMRADIGMIGVNYGFASRPSYGNKYMDVYLTGDVYWDGKKVKQVTPAVFPALKQTSKMVYIRVSQAVFNNLFRVAHEHKIFQKTIKYKIGGKSNGLLGSVGSFLSPSVTITIKTATAPTLSFTTSGVSIRITCEVILKGSTVFGEFDSKVTMELNANTQLRLSENKLAVASKRISSRFLDNIKPKSLPIKENVIKDVEMGFIKDQLSGFKLPLPDYLSLMNSAVTSMNGFIMIEADAEIRM